MEAYATVIIRNVPLDWIILEGVDLKRENSSSCRSFRRSFHEEASAFPTVRFQNF